MIGNEKCKVSIITWGNTNNNYKPSTVIEFEKYEEAIECIKKVKDTQFGYMHKINLTYTVEDFNLNNIK